MNNCYTLLLLLLLLLLLIVTYGACPAVVLNKDLHLSIRSFRPIHKSIYKIVYQSKLLTSKIWLGVQTILRLFT